MAILLGSVLVVYVPWAGAQMIKCVDARGVTHYTDKPQPGCRGGAVNIKPIPSLSGAGKAPAAKDDQATEQAFRRRQIERSTRDEKDAKERLAREKQCERLKLDRALLERASRVYGTDAQGKYGPLDDAARVTRLAQYDDQIAQACR
ncbi:MAG: DUF4124 domain-containing protein [Proteobacteria bacterium]|nr:DUF4124 domain-containing protein [Pseudomonadota bacterium]